MKRNLITSVLAVLVFTVLLAGIVFAVVTPAFLQDAGPGKPDDVAQLLPEETLGFAEIVKAPRLLHDWKDYVGGLTTADGKEKLCAFIEEWFTKAIEIAYETNPPPVVRGHVAKLRFAHPSGTKPPTFVVHGNRLRTLFRK